MKERPIIFSTDMVKAIPEGRKTMTRRVIKPQPNQFMETAQTYPFAKTAYFYNHARTTMQFRECPYGQVGDRLWVRETLYRYPYFNEASYLADETPVFINQTIGDMAKWQWQKDTLPSIFMPRWASRIDLEITEVRAERLQEITSLDAVLEGCPKYHEYNEKWECIKIISPIDRFHNLWDSLNAKRGYSWESNPWVWVISFKRVTE